MYATQSLTDRLTVSSTGRLPSGLMVTVAFAFVGLLAFAFGAICVPGFVESLPTFFVG
jgi:hypothetical protein